MRRERIPNVAGGATALEPAWAPAGPRMSGLPRGRPSNGSPRAAQRVVVASGMAGTGVSTVAAGLGERAPALDVMDAGARWAEVAETCAAGFAKMLVVTTRDPVSIAAAYALVKLVRDQFPDGKLELLVTRSTERDALRTYERLQGAAEHFLGETIGYGGAVPDGAERPDAAATPGPGAAERSWSGVNGVSAALDALAARLEEELNPTAGRTTALAAARR